MNPNFQPFVPGTRTGLYPSNDVLKEEHEVSVLGGPQSSMAARTTVVNIQTDTVVPDHIVWSLFNTLFFNPCCLGFVAFAYSVKGPEDGGRRDWGPELSSTAKCLNIWAVVLGLLVILGIIITVVIIASGVYHR